MSDELPVCPADVLPGRNTTFFGRNLDTPALDNANKILKEGQRIDGKEPKFPHNFAGAY